MLRHTHCLLVFFAVAFCDDLKGLLLNDQDVLKAKLHQMELRMQSLESQKFQLLKGNFYVQICTCMSGNVLIIKYVMISELT